MATIDEGLSWDTVILKLHSRDSDSLRSAIQIAASLLERAIERDLTLHHPKYLAASVADYGGLVHAYRRAMSFRGLPVSIAYLQLSVALRNATAHEALSPDYDIISFCIRQFAAAWMKITGQRLNIPIDETPNDIEKKTAFDQWYEQIGESGQRLLLAITTTISAHPEWLGDEKFLNKADHIPVNVWRDFAQKVVPRLGEDDLLGRSEFEHIHSLLSSIGSDPISLRERARTSIGRLHNGPLTDVKIASALDTVRKWLVWYVGVFFVAAILFLYGSLFEWRSTRAIWEIVVGGGIVCLLLAPFPLLNSLLDAVLKHFGFTDTTTLVSSVSRGLSGFVALEGGLMGALSVFSAPSQVRMLAALGVLIIYGAAQFMWRHGIDHTAQLYIGRLSNIGVFMGIALILVAFLKAYSEGETTFVAEIRSAPAIPGFEKGSIPIIPTPRGTFFLAEDVLGSHMLQSPQNSGEIRLRTGSELTLPGYMVVASDNGDGTDSYRIKASPSKLIGLSNEAGATEYSSFKDPRLLKALQANTSPPPPPAAHSSISGFTRAERCLLPPSDPEHIPGCGRRRR